MDYDKLLRSLMTTEPEPEPEPTPKESFREVLPWVLAPLLVIIVPTLILCREPDKVLAIVASMIIVGGIVLWLFGVDG